MDFAPSNVRFSRTNRSIKVRYMSPRHSAADFALSAPLRLRPHFDLILQPVPGVAQENGSRCGLTIGSEMDAELQVKPRARRPAADAAGTSRSPSPAPQPLPDRLARTRHACATDPKRYGKDDPAVTGTMERHS